MVFGIVDVKYYEFLPNYNCNGTAIGYFVHWRKGSERRTTSSEITIGTVRAWRFSPMRQPTIDDFVRLTQDIPELALVRGEVGVIRSTWFAPTIAYEVEFHPVGLEHQTRALLLAEQVTLEEGPLLSAEVVVEESTTLIGSR